MWWKPKQPITPHNRSSFPSCIRNHHQYNHTSRRQQGGERTSKSQLPHPYSSDQNKIRTSKKKLQIRNTGPIGPTAIQWCCHLHNPTPTSRHTPRTRQQVYTPIITSPQTSPPGSYGCGAWKICLLPTAWSPAHEGADNYEPRKKITSTAHLFVRWISLNTIQCAHKGTMTWSCTACVGTLKKENKNTDFKTLFETKPVTLNCSPLDSMCPTQLGLKNSEALKEEDWTKQKIPKPSTTNTTTEGDVVVSRTAHSFF